MNWTGTQAGPRDIYIYIYIASFDQLIHVGAQYVEHSETSDQEEVKERSSKLPAM